MKEKLKKIFTTSVTFVCAIVLTVMIGCSSFQDAVTPCYIPNEIIETTDVNIPILKWMPYTSLFDAKYVRTKMEFQYLLHKNLLNKSMEVSEAFQQRLFSPEGPIGLLIPALGGFGLGSLLISKPKDKKEIEKLKNGS